MLLGDLRIASLFEQGLHTGYMLMIILFGISCCLIQFIVRKSIFASPAEKRKYRQKQVFTTMLALLLVVVINESLIAMDVIDPETTIPLLSSPMMWAVFIAGAMGIQVLKKRIRAHNP